ncbi:MAG: LEPR-XLL domain-containing protein [Nitrospira sp.]|nr:LEPR-XLL domain-containing protein [Nitrospira sp.]MBH0185633.1 LEPR-XLL domain-containing protein [Nitrospira sp.]
MKRNNWLKWFNRNRREAGKAFRPSADQSRPSSQAFVLESLEDRIMLSATPMEAVVTTDKADYSPGETAIITTSNVASTSEGATFADGEMVQFQVTRTDGIEDYPSGNLPWYVIDGIGGFDAYQDTIVDSNGDGVAESGDRNGDGQADWIRPDNDLTVNGSISTTWFVEDQYADSSLLLTATGLASGTVAMHEFTDSVTSINIDSPTTASPVTVAAGNSFTIQYDAATTTTVVNPGAQTFVSQTVTARLVAGSTSIVVGTDTGLPTGTVSNRSFVVTVPTGSADGTYRLVLDIVQTFSGGGTRTGSSFQNSAVTVSTPAIATTTTVSSSDSTTTYGDAVGFTANVTGSPSVGTVRFYVDGNAFGPAVNVVNGVATSGSISNLDAGNHNVYAVYSGASGFAGSTSGTIVQNVAQKSITGSFTVSNKVYDGTTSATIVSRSLNGVLVGDVVNLTGGSATFDTENVGTGKTVTGTGFSFGGADKDNYVLVPATLTTTANITARALTVTATGVNKVYDGGTTATVTLSDNRLSGDVFTASYTTATFADKNVGTGKTVSVSGISISGTDAGNYTFNTTASTTANITPATASIVVNGHSGVYDGQFHGATLGSAVGVNNEDLSSSVTIGTETFKDVPGGTVAWSFTNGNYVSQSDSVAITITPATLTITATAQTKTFGETFIFDTTIPSSHFSVSGLVDGDAVTSVTLVSDGAVAWATVGPYAITASAVVGDGMGNYTIGYQAGTLTVVAPTVVTAVKDGNGNLLIVGTNGCDIITVNASKPGAITVNGTGSYNVDLSNDHVIVYGLGCDDTISLSGNVNLEAHGGLGNDTITGGAGHDVLWGNQGNDTLTGSAGNDVLIGGYGSDRVVGSAGHDILVAGELSSTFGYDSLREMSANWAANWVAEDDLADSNSDGDVVDESFDQLTGSSGHDWFIVSSNDKITDINSLTKDSDKRTII